MFEIEKKLKLICTSPICDDDFIQTIDDFQQEYATTPFWLERNVTITDDEDRSDAVIRFNIKKVSFRQMLIDLLY